MEAKLTLHLDEELITTAKRHAQQRGTSLSKLVADYLQMLSVKTVSAKNTSGFEPTPILSEITGVLSKTSHRKNVRKEYHDYLEEKFL